jgi:hypothetical protein
MCSKTKGKSIIAMGDLLGPAVYSYVGFPPVVAIGLPQEFSRILGNLSLATIAIKQRK